MSTGFINIPGECPYCSGPSQKIFHGGACPKVKSIEYWPDGTIKKVEFRDPQQNTELDAAFKSLVEFKMEPDEGR